MIKNIRASITHEFLRMAHRYNAIFLSVFIIVHMVTHLSGLLGIETYNTVQDAFRTIYRILVIEILLLVSISAQLLVGACLVVHRIRIKGISGFWGWLQVISGIAFLLFILQHLYSLGMTRLYFGLDTNFYWPASVMRGPWFIYYFAPYYTLGVFALFAHIGAGIRYAMIDRGNPVLGQRLGVSLLIAGTIISLIIPLILAGAFFPIELPDEWINYLRFYAPNFEP